MKSLRVSETHWVVLKVVAYVAWALSTGAVLLMSTRLLGGGAPYVGIVVLEALFILVGLAVCFYAPVEWLVGPNEFGWRNIFGRASMVTLESVERIGMSGKGTMLEIATKQRTVRAEYHWLASNRLLLDLVEALAQTPVRHRMEPGVRMIADARLLARRLLEDSNRQSELAAARQAVYEGRFQRAVRLYSKAGGRMSESEQELIRTLSVVPLPYQRRRGMAKLP